MQETPDIPDLVAPDAVDMPQGPHPLALAGLALSLLALVIMVILGFFAGYFDLTLTNLAAWGAVGPLGAILSAAGMRRTPRSLGAVGLALGACATVFLALLMVDKAQRDQDLALKIAQQQHLAQADGAPATAPAGTYFYRVMVGTQTHGGAIGRFVLTK